MLSMWATSLTLLTVSIHDVLSLPANGTAWYYDARDIDILSRPVPAAPHFVIYGDAYDGNTGPPAVPEIQVRKHVLSTPLGEVSTNMCGCGC